MEFCSDGQSGQSGQSAQCVQCVQKQQNWIDTTIVCYKKDFLNAIH